MCYKIYRAGLNGCEKVETVEEIELLLVFIVHNPNHIYAIKHVCGNGTEEDVKLASLAGFMDGYTLANIIMHYLEFPYPYVCPECKAKAEEKEGGAM